MSDHCLSTSVRPSTAFGAPGLIPSQSSEINGSGSRTKWDKKRELEVKHKMIIFYPWINHRRASCILTSGWASFQLSLLHSFPNKVVVGREELREWGDADADMSGDRRRLKMGFGPREEGPALPLSLLPRARACARRRPSTFPISTDDDGYWRTEERMMLGRHEAASVKTWFRITKANQVQILISDKCCWNLKLATLCKRC